MSDPPPAQIGPYRVIREIGRGGMGVVYLARDTRLERDVAIKALPPDLADDAGRLARFEREARLLASLNHPNVATIHGLEELHGRKYLVLEYVAGESLTGFVNRTPSWRKCIEAAAAVADGLAAAHDSGVVHRDIKPDNVLFTKDGLAKLLDFGIATPVASHDADDPSEDATRSIGTSPGAVTGTPGYMSPEQVRGQPVDTRSDIFSFGCLLHEMLTGRPTFARGTIADSMAATLRDEPRGPVESGVGIPHDLDRIIMRCLEKRPEDRFQSARDLAFSLRAALDSADASRGRDVTTPSPGHRGRLVGAIVISLVIVVIGAVAAITAWRLLPTGSGRGPIRSLAVLPLVNESDDTSLDFLCQGIAETIINRLSRVESLRVVPRSSTFRRAAEGGAVGDIAASLGVQAVLSGRVMQRGDAYVVSVTLVDADRDAQLWGMRFEPTDDLQDVERRICAQIAEELGLDVRGGLSTRLGATSTHDPEAHRLYLEARFWLAKRTPAGLEKALELHERALQRDDGFALAWAGKAETHALMGFYSHPPREVMPLAKRAAERAIESDPTLASAHAALGFTRFLYDWDWQGAEEAFREAIAQDPRHPTARHWYGVLLDTIGRREEATRELKEALRLDPGSLSINQAFAMHATPRGDTGARLAGLRRVLEMDPTFASAHDAFGDEYVATGRFDDAVASYRRAFDLSGSTKYLGLTGYAHGLAGHRADAIAILERLTTERGRAYVPARSLALIHFGLGDGDRAFEYLSRAFDDRDGGLPYLKYGGLFNPLRGDPRFDALIERLEYPPGPPAPVVAPWQAPVPRVAILPFEASGANPDLAYLAEEIPASIIDALATLTSLAVIPRGTAFRHRDCADDVSALGRRLQADFIVTGSLHGRGDGLRLRAELIDVASSSQQWSDRYDRSLVDTRVVETEVTNRIVDALRLQITGDEYDRLERRRPTSAAAHAAYLEGRYWWNRRTLDSLDRALDLFQAAADIDDTFALAYGAQAETYGLLAVYGRRANDLRQKMIDAATRALELDPTLAAAHAAMAAYHRLQGDLEAAEAAYRRALGFDPRYATAHQWFGLFLAYVGRFDEAVAHVEQARAIDPGSMTIQRERGTVEYLRRDFEAAERAYAEALAMDPSVDMTRTLLGTTLVALGRYEEAIVELEASSVGGSVAWFTLGQLGIAHARAGHVEEAARILKDIEARTGETHSTFCIRALVHAALGDMETAFDLLTRAVNDAEFLVSWMKHAEAFDPFRDDARFDVLLERVGF
ncbi:MAG: protein kinase domain-containing protein [Planctomycetota bacterium]|jgi:serine/threonine-protein kinase